MPKVSIMVYTPTKNPLQSLILITIIVAAGVFGGRFISQYFMAFALVFWIQYTAVLSYLQFKHGKKHSHKSFTEWLLYPQVRFFVFEFLALIGLGALILKYNLLIGDAALIAWWLFSLNFYIYYTKKGHFSPEERAESRKQKKARKK